MPNVAMCLLWLLVFFIPVENVIVFEQFGTVGRAVGLGAAAAGGLAILLGHELRRMNLFQGFLLAFMSWSLATFYWSVDPASSLTAIKTLGQLYLFVLLLWWFALTPNHCLKLLAAYACGAIVSSIWTIHAYFSQAQFSYQRYATTGFDPNDLGVMLAIAVPIIGYLGRRGSSSLLRGLWYVGLPIVALAVIFTASRAAFLALVIGLGFVLADARRTTVLTKLLLGSLVLTTILIFQAVGLEPSLERIASFGGELQSGHIGARTPIWLSGLQAFTVNPVSGWGAGCFGAAVETFYGIPRSSHNLFLAVLVGQGAIGLILFTGLLGWTVGAVAGRRSSHRGLWVALLLCWAVGAMSLSWEFKKVTWFLLGLLAAWLSLEDSASTLDQDERPPAALAALRRQY